MRAWETALAIIAVVIVIIGSAPAASATPRSLDAEQAVAASQAAVGRVLGDHAFTDTRNRRVRLTDFRGRPLVVNMVYTGCADICPTVSEALARAVDVARGALGSGSFHVVTVGFDPRDTPDRMRSYARSHGQDGAGWDFLSGTGDAAGRLADDLGFLYFAAPQGFDHVAQTTVIDADGRIYRHIYGAAFEPPALVEPLKDLIWGRPAAGVAAAARLVDRIKLICTVYDASSGRYRFSYAIFISIGLSGLTLCAIGFVIARAWLRSRRADPPLAPARQ